MLHLRRFGVIGLAVGLIILAGCSAPAPKPKTTLQPIIAPEKANISAARVCIFSLRTPQGDPGMGSHLAHQLHQFLLARRIARIVEVVPEGFSDVNEAIDRARILGYDVAVLGQVQESFWGGRIEPSRATVELRVVDTVRRVTIWYLRASATADYLQAYDFGIWRTDIVLARTPMDLIRKLLIEMADELADWAHTHK